MSQESIKGELSYVDPNYDLLGNAITYKVANITNDRPNQGYENSLLLLVLVQDLNSTKMFLQI